MKAAAIDVYYIDDPTTGTSATAVAVVFDVESSAIFEKHTSYLTDITEYVPGEFYKRELPCAMHVLDALTEDYDVIIADSYVWLDDDMRGGLGKYLHDATGKPVIGVAKNKYHGVDAVAREVTRGESKKPLFVTAAGVEVDEAAGIVKAMHGDFRIPTVLKELDTMTRK